MAVESDKVGSDGKVWSFCSMPFWQTTHASSSSSSTTTTIPTTSSMHHSVHHQSQILQSLDRSTHQPSTTVSSVAKSLLPTRRRLRLDPPNKLYFPCMSLIINPFLFLASVSVLCFCYIILFKVWLFISFSFDCLWVDWSWLMCPFVSLVFG